MWRDNRGRLTVPDVVYVLLALAVIGALYPVLEDVLESNHDMMQTGTEYLYFLILPLGLLVLFTMIFVKATAGVNK